MKSKSIASAAGFAGVSLFLLGVSGTGARAAILYVNNTGTPACSNSNAGTSAAAPLCSPLTAYAKSAANDTILITPGTYPMTSNLDLRKAGQTWQRSVPTGYAALDGLATLHVGIWIHAPNITLDGLKLFNHAPFADTGQRYYSIGADPLMGLTIRNCYIDVPQATTGGVPGCVSCSAAISFTGGKFLIENNIIRGSYAVGIWPQNTYQMYNSGGVLYNQDPPDAGGTIRNNTFLMEGPDSGSSSQSQLGMLIETIGRWDKHATWLIYNNEFISTTVHNSRSWGIYAREIAVSLRIWNNRMTQVGTCFYLQEAQTTCANQNGSCATEDIVIFNNTCDTGSVTRGGSSGMYIDNCVTAQLKNNLYKGYGYGIDYRGCNSGCTSSSTSNGGGPHDTPGGGMVANNLFYRATNPNGYSDITYFNGAYHNANLSAPQCGDIGPFSGNFLSGGNPNLTTDGLLQAGSSAVDRGTSNPLGQGAGVCSLSDGTRTVLCNLDAKGTPRGTGAGWDIGWHEFVSTGPTDPAPPPPSISRGDLGAP